MGVKKVFQEVESKVVEVNDKLDAKVDNGVNTVVSKTGRFTFLAAVGAGVVVLLVVVGLLAI